MYIGVCYIVVPRSTMRVRTERALEPVVAVRLPAERSVLVWLLALHVTLTRARTHRTQHEINIFFYIVFKSNVVCYTPAVRARYNIFLNFLITTLYITHNTRVHSIFFYTFCVYSHITYYLDIF